MKSILLFCLPYAGGSATIYSNWQDYLNTNVLVQPIELAGRGKRIGERYYETFDEASLDVIKQIKPEIRSYPFAFFGHSMGAGIAFHVSLMLKKMKLPQPAHIFFSGRGAPSIMRKDKPPFHTLEEDEFRKKVLQLGGTPEEFFQYPELVEILLPLLKADFKISWEITHFYSKIGFNGEKLGSNISIFIGKEDDINLDQIQAWKDHSIGHCEIHYFEGGHFFLNQNEEKNKMLMFINEKLCKISQQFIPVYV